MAREDATLLDICEDSGILRDVNRQSTCKAVRQKSSTFCLSIRDVPKEIFLNARFSSGSS
jgi:hypothetical protein